MFISKLLGRRAPEPVQTTVLQEFVDPEHLFPPERMIRLGTEYGGWSIPQNNDLGPDSTCYCAGAGEDISFDCALAAAYHCRIRIIDPTPRAIAHFQSLAEATRKGEPFCINNNPEHCYRIEPQDFERLTFLPYGLAEEAGDHKFFMPRNKDHVSCSMVNLQKTDEYFTASCKPLADIMREMNDASIDLLKMDIEGAEYAVIRNLIDTATLPRLLLIEFDEVHTQIDQDFRLRLQKSFELLREAGMRCVFVEDSNATFIKQSN